MNAYSMTTGGGKAVRDGAYTGVAGFLAFIAVQLFLSNEDVTPETFSFYVVGLTAVLDGVLKFVRNLLQVKFGIGGEE